MVGEVEQYLNFTQNFFFFFPRQVFVINRFFGFFRTKTDFSCQKNTKIYAFSKFFFQNIIRIYLSYNMYISESLGEVSFKSYANVTRAHPQRMATSQRRNTCIRWENKYISKVMLTYLLRLSKNTNRFFGFKTSFSRQNRFFGPKPSFIN